MRDLFTHLSLVQNNALVCPFCGTLGTVTCEQIEPPQMACDSCRKKGHLVQVVKAARKIRDWEAIAFLEKLAVAPVVAEPPAVPTAPEAPVAPAPEPAIAATPVLPATEPEPPAMPDFPAFTPNRAETYRERVVRIKETCRLEAVVEREAGVTFKRVGANLFCNCPFPDHQDSSPSFALDPVKQLFHCLGCGKSGDVITFIELFKHLGFRESLDYLDPEGATKAGQSAHQDLLENQGNSLPSSSSGHHPHHSSDILRLRDFFHERLLESKAAQDYLASRGLRDAAHQAFSPGL